MGEKDRQLGHSGTGWDKHLGNFPQVLFSCLDPVAQALESLFVAWWSKAHALKSWSEQTAYGQSDYMQIRSPWAGDSVLNAILGVTGTATEVTVKSALSVPAVSRAIALNSVVAAGSPWVPVEQGQTLPAWANKSWNTIPAGKRRAGLVQDILLHNQALLAVERDESAAIVDALWWPKHSWQLDAKGQICTQDQTGRWAAVADQSKFIWIPGLLPMSFMEYAAESIGQYVGLCNTITNRSKSPIPLVELKVTQDWTGTREELAAAQRAWNTAREAEGGSTAVTPYGVTVIVHPGGEDAAMLIEARNAIRVDFANFTNLNASIVDGASGASDTYSNTLQDANEFLRLSTGLWMMPITQRLSQDDALGLEITWDHSKFDLTPATGNTGQAVTTSLPNGS